MPDLAEVEFKKAIVPDEVPLLCDFDRRVFGNFPDDLFDSEYWAELESYWVLSGGVMIGCTALQPNVDYDEEPKSSSLFIASTGLLPEFQGRGIGNRIKEWQIRYAQEHEFKRIITNAREGNVASISLNKKFGFRVRERIADYYSNPVEAAIVMELLLGERESAN